MTSDWLLLLWVLIGSCLLMVVLHALHKRIGNAGIVDVGWAFALGMSAVVYAAFADGDIQRRIMLAIIGGGWGLRLAWHLLTDRVIGAPEDGRYTMLRDRWGEDFARRLPWFFQAQAVLVAILSVPFLLIATSASSFPSIFDIVGISIWLIGIVGEAIADEQLKAFKRQGNSKGRTCRRGLWRYSRHPNYFFEWVIWLGFACVALGAPFGWIGLLSPALLLLLVLKVTGIPPTEARAIQSRGDDYRQYQRETSAFFPWFPRKAKA